MRIRDVLAGRTAVLVIAGLLSCQPLAKGAPYQSLSDDVPSYLPPGVKDSTLLAWGPPFARLPSQVKWDHDEPLVWMRITVGEKGRAVNSEVVYPTALKKDMTRAAREAAESALFYAVWDGPSPVEYVGYYPVDFTNRTTDTWATQGDRPGSPVYPELAKYVGRDAPIVTPISPLIVKWPELLSDSVAEVTAWVRAHITTGGNVKDCSPTVFLESLFAFETCAIEAVKGASFPVKISGNQAREYDAYVPVHFIHGPGYFHRLNLPEFDEANTFDLAPVPISSLTLGVVPAMLQAGINGNVGMRVLVSSEGKVLSARIDSASEYFELDRLAHFRAPALQFKPANRGGVPIAAWTNVTLKFVPVQQDEQALALSDSVTYPTSSRFASRDSEEPTPEPGEFQELDRAPEIIREIGAAYPREALRAGLQGKVILWALIDRDGTVVDCRVAKSSGLRAFDESAMAALRQFTLKPGFRNGKPVRCWISKQFVFTIN